MQDALRPLVVIQPGGGAQLLKRLAAVSAQADNLLDVVARASRRAFPQELQAPQPLPLVRAQAKQQRRIFLAQPLQDLERGTGVGPGFGVADRNLPPIGKTGFCSRGGLTVDDADLVTELR